MMDTVFLIKDELASAERGQLVLTRHTFKGTVTSALHAASAAVAGTTPRILRIVAAIEVRFMRSASASDVPNLKGPQNAEKRALRGKNAPSRHDRCAAD